MFNGISNTLRIGNTLIGGSFLDKGILVCEIEGQINNSTDLNYIYQKNEEPYYFP